jgi:CO/xanthine dehydrogenase FAD-binding subunit
MIIEYHRPQTLDEALELLRRKSPPTYPLGGGTVLNQASSEQFAVVDLQALGLDKIRKVGEKLEIGASTTLSLLLESPHVHPALALALQIEVPLNLRNMATVAGALVACDGRSPFTMAMLALDARMTVISNQSSVTSLGDFLPIRKEFLPGKLITKIEIPLNVELAFERVARTPDDSPIICAALVRWPSGRTRLALGGWGKAPALALDGNQPGGEEVAARNAFAEAGDEWASAEYRSEMASVLVGRCLETLA